MYILNALHQELYEERKLDLFTFECSGIIGSLKDLFLRINAAIVKKKKKMNQLWLFRREIFFASLNNIKQLFRTRYILINNIVTV